MKKTKEDEGRTMSFTFRQSGVAGCEILNAEGQVFAWAIDPTWAAVIVAALNGLAQPPELHSQDGPRAIACNGQWTPRPAPLHQDCGDAGPVEAKPTACCGRCCRSRKRVNEPMKGKYET
jgi:hypothetical protein